MNKSPYTRMDHELIERIQHWLRGDGHTKSALARAAGISTGTVTQVLNGQYPSPPATHLEAMVAAVDRDDSRRAGAGDIPYTPTSVSRALHGVIRRAHLDRDFGLFAGRVGIGKTVR